MKKYLPIIVSFFLLISIIISGCFEQKSKTDEEKFVGTWKAEESKYRMFTFNSDGTCLINSYKLKGTYHINSKGQLVINQTNPLEVYVYTYRFKDNDNKLILTDIEDEYPYVFIKQK